MKYITLLLAIVFLSCSSSSIKKMQENDSKFSMMIDSCRYFIVVNNKEQKHVKEFQFVNNGCVKIVYPRNDYYGCKWDTAIICGNYGITKRY